MKPAAEIPWWQAAFFLLVPNLVRAKLAEAGVPWPLAGLAAIVLMLLMAWLAVLIEDRDEPVV